MITMEEVHDILSKYDQDKISIATICSHSALQIFHGAKKEGFRTVGIVTKDKKWVYESFPLACPDEFIVVDNYLSILEESVQNKLIENNAVIVPHGSFVEYVKPQNISNSFYVPMFGNRKTLEWEANRRKVREWLKKANINLPVELNSPSEIRDVCMVKFSGARGGRGFFLAKSEEEFNQKLENAIQSGMITEKDKEGMVIQEFIVGVRYYPHYFYSLFSGKGAKAGKGTVELLGVDKRVESNVDELHRTFAAGKKIEPTYSVTGNESLVLRESLLPKYMIDAVNVVNVSTEMFPPGVVGPFCIETICDDNLKIYAFELSARIVAGTNLFPHGSPYSCYYYDDMSMGRRIAKEIKDGLKLKRLADVVY